MEKIRIGIAGYGNLGRGVEAALSQSSDMELAAVLSRRTALKTNTGVSVFPLDSAADHRDKIDVMILCGGSRDDLPQQGPALAAHFTTVDSFDTHAKIPDYFARVDAVARSSNNVAIISVGWDPGLFSLIRLYGEATLPQGHTTTFWGKGVSQGHSDALRRVPGVAGAVQYTVPVEAAVEQARNGQGENLSTREKHTRHCYVVLAEGADQDRVRELITTMPDYFADYETTVNFISAEELARDHGAMPHGGFVIRHAKAGSGTGHKLEFSLQLESNPDFTASVLVAYARAAHRLKSAGESGARTVLDIAPVLLSPKKPEDLRRELL